MTDEPTNTDRIDGRDASRKGTVPLNHPVLDELDDETTDWLQQVAPTDATQTAASIIEVERIRRNRWWEWRAMMNWMSKGKGSESRIQLMRLLAENQMGVTYDDISDRLDVSKRRARTFVKELRDREVVESVGRPAQIRFVDDDLFILASDLAAWY